MTEQPASAAPAMTCLGCESAIIDLYFLAGGTKPVCASCKTQLEGAPLGPVGPAFAKAAGLGLLASLAAAGVWAAIVIITHLQLGLVAVAVGYVVGLAVRRGAGRHSGGIFQALAIALSVLAIVWSTIPMVFHSMPSRTPAAAVAPDAPVLKLKILESGQVLADGAPISNDQIASRVGDIKQKHGMVWYWREHPERPSDELPPAQDASASAVISAVTKGGVPIKRVQDDLGTPAPTPTSSSSGWAKGIGFLLFVMPFIVYGAMVSSDPVSLLFLGIAVYEAWKLNRRRTLLFTGPFARAAALDFSAP